MMRKISNDRIKFPDEVEPCLSKIPNSGIGVRCKTAINDGMFQKFLQIFCCLFFTI